MTEVIYRPSATCKQFHKSGNFVRALAGPIGSGKSVACCVELMMKAHAQAPNELGIRKTRFAVIRNTYRQLIDTTMNTFFDWFPKSIGDYRAGDLKWVYTNALPDGTHVQAEFLFRALDRSSDINKLLSLELTAGWINEAREVPKAILDMLCGRVGRYPSKREGGPTYFGVILDTNMPDSDHWWYKLFEEMRPDNYSLFKQPSGLGPLAENIDNLPPGYYINMQGGKDRQWIDVYCNGNYGFVSDGKPVYPEYHDDLHFTDEPYIPTPKSTLYLGIDFGLTPACTFAQITPSGQLVTFDELTTFDMGQVSFGKLLKERINTVYRGFNSIEIYGDPAGEQRAQTDEQTPFMILDQQGIVAFPTYTNDYTIRREVVAEYMTRLDFSGKPAFRLTPGCQMLRKAYQGGYKFKRQDVTGEERYQDKPNKNRYSHVAESHQYLFLGAVGDNRVIGGYGNQPLDYSAINRAIV